MTEPLQISESLTIPAADLHWSAARGSGPGGQNVNKVASKVELRFDIAGTTTLSPAVKERLRAIAGNRIDADGRLLITCQESRDQRSNLEEALRKLRDLILKALTPPKKRRPTKPTRASKERRLAGKRAHAEKKRRRTSDSE
ncbi:MAG TPA: alternative ribosome rescue aminoacyl-tRNA hydrolase ArfB [Candidatus Ozemobacteraceae bacterium]|nr:alternative ribosome rescue aminoacyl-tRNA hydrolase ArfB [Candidatus Ozemobacteraceae bacterium]